EILVPEVGVDAQSRHTVFHQRSAATPALGAGGAVARQIVPRQRDGADGRAVATGDVDTAVAAVGDRAVIDDDARDRRVRLGRDLDAVVDGVANANPADDDVAGGDLERAASGAEVI